MDESERSEMHRIGLNPKLNPNGSVYVIGIQVIDAVENRDA